MNANHPQGDKKLKQGLPGSLHEHPHGQEGTSGWFDPYTFSSVSSVTLYPRKLSTEDP